MRLLRISEQQTGTEVRVTVPGHTQRGGSPCPYDRVLSTRIGAEAAQADPGRSSTGTWSALLTARIKKVPLAECAGKLKTVDPNDQDVHGCKADGYQFWRLRVENRSDL